MQRLKLEEELEALERRVGEQSDAHERLRGRQRALATLLDGWVTLSLDEKKALLRGLVDRVVVRDEGMDLVLHP